MAEIDGYSMIWKIRLGTCSALVRVVLLWLFVSGVTGCVLLKDTYIPSTPTSMSINHKIQEVQNLSEQWTRNDIYLLSNRADVTMDASSGKFCFLGALQEDTLKRNMICTESLTGIVLWNKVSGVHETISVTPEGVFVAYSSSASVRKFNLETGNLIWKESLPGSGSAYLFYVNNQIQVVTLTYTDTLSVLDLDGNLLNSYKDQQAILISTPKDTFFHLTGIRALNTSTGNVIWDYVDHGLQSAPYFTQDKIFLRNGDFSGTAYALERDTGSLLWKVDGIVGNVVYSPDKRRIYALREDGSLLAIDENNGRVNIVAKFSNTPFLFIKDGEAQAYQLAYDPSEHILIVALGDGNQIFAFMEE